MTALLSKAAAAALLKLIGAAFTEKFLIKLSIGLMKILAAKTTNTLDDELVVEVEKALGE